MKVPEHDNLHVFYHEINSVRNLLSEKESERKGPPSQKINVDIFYGWVKAVIKRWGNLPSKELIGVKPFRPKIWINRLEYIVCKAFEGKKEELEPGYSNIARQTIRSLAVNYGGMTLKEVGQWKESVPSVNVTSPASGGRETLRANNYVCVWMDCTSSGSE